MSLRLSRSFKVIDFDTNRKPTCDFILVNNTNLHHILHPIQIIADIGQIFVLVRSTSNTLVMGEPLNSRL